jgi:hypothetical protein
MCGCLCIVVSNTYCLVFCFSSEVPVPRHEFCRQCGMCCVHFIIITYLNKRRQWLCEPNNWTLSKSKSVTINVREYRRANQKCTIQRNCQHMVHKPKKNKTQDNMCYDKRKDKQLSTKHTHKTKDRVILCIANIRYDVCMKTVFGSSLPLVVCRRAHVLLTLCVVVCA